MGRQILFRKWVGGQKALFLAIFPHFLKWQNGHKILQDYALYNPACQTKSKVHLQKIHEYSFWKLRTVNTIPIRRGCWYVKILLYKHVIKLRLQYVKTWNIWLFVKYSSCRKLFNVYAYISIYLYIYKELKEILTINVMWTVALGIWHWYQIKIWISLVQNKFCLCLSF